LRRCGRHSPRPGETMNTNYLVTLAIGGLMLIGVASAQEKKIKRSDLPPAVEKTVAAQSAGATIRGLSTEKEKGQTLYEVEMTVNGHSKDISIAPDGAIVEIEEQVALDSLSRKSKRDYRPRPAREKFSRSSPSPKKTSSWPTRLRSRQTARNLSSGRTRRQTARSRRVVR